MAKHGEEMNEDTQKFFSIPVKRRREMENRKSDGRDSIFV